MSKQSKRIEALVYHAKPTPGKIKVVPTKKYASQRDLSLAYSPGVAEPCLEIEKEVNNAHTRYLCGEYVPLDFKIKTLAGETIFNSFQELRVDKIKIGSHELPFAINKIAEGAFQNSTRTALIPTESILKNTNDEETHYLPEKTVEQLKTNDFYLLEANIN